MEIQQFKDILEISKEPPTEPIISIKSSTGGEIIMPNYIKEAFDTGKVTSVKDII